MKNGNQRRPYSRPRRQTNAQTRRVANSQSPVFQPLEPRKLLTTLYGDVSGNAGQVGFANVFTGWIAMPSFITDPGQTLDASSVEERSVRVRIAFYDNNPDASVTILDLNGNPLFPWLGQSDGNGGFDTEIDVVTFDEELPGPGVGEDGYWGTEDDTTESVFGLDGGVIPGWKWFAGEDETLYTDDDIVSEGNFFHPVRDLTWEDELEAETLFDFDFDAGFPVDVDARDLLGNGALTWDTNDNAGEGNYTTGDALAATASVRQGNGAFDTVLELPSVNLANWTNGSLDFNLNYQHNGSDRLYVEASSDGGNNWDTVIEYAEDHGGFRGNNSGEDMSVDLSAYAGQANVRVRFRYTGDTSDAIYAQVDDVTFEARLSGWDVDGFELTDELTKVIPQTGFWDPGEDGIFNGEGFLPWSSTADDYRLPADYISKAPNAGNDARETGGWLYADGTNRNPRFRPDNTMTFMNLVDLNLDPRMDGALAQWVGANAADARHVLGVANDGIADFNNGIGQIIFSGTSAGTRFSISVIDDEGNVIAPFALPENENIGVDLDRDDLYNRGIFSVTQALGMGSVVIGNNTNVDWTAIPTLEIGDLIPNLAGQPGFGDVGGWYIFDKNNADSWQQWSFDGSLNWPDRLPQGISFADPDLHESIGTINIDGSLYGVSRFAGAVGSLNVGFLGGDIIVEGQLENLIVAGDAGFIEYVDGNRVSTGADVTVGRNVGSIVVGGTSSLEINVIGDVSDPAARPGLYVDQQTVVEAEIDLRDADEDAHYFNFALGGVKFTRLAGAESDDESVGYLTNDTLGSAQFIGRMTGRSEVYGTLGTTPAFGIHQNGGDTFDTYAFVADGQQEVRIAIFDSAGLEYNNQVTIVDERGEALAYRSGPTGQLGDIIFRPNRAGLYYIVMENTTGRSDYGYKMVVQGMQGVTLGEYNAYRPMRYMTALDISVKTAFGSIGTVRAGLDAIEVANGWMGNLAIDAAKDLWNVSAGSSIGYRPPSGADNASGARAVSFSAAGDIGSIVAGAGTGDDGATVGGSIVSGRVTAGNNIGGLYAYAGQEATRDSGDIGGIGTGASLTDITNRTVSGVIVEAGNRIGVIHADNRIWASSNTQILYGAGGGVDLIEASANMSDSETAANRDLNMAASWSGIIATDGTPLFIQSAGSAGNVRFVRTPSAFASFNNDDSIIIGADQEITLVDDSGSVFTVKVTGGTTFGGDSTSSARVVTQAVQGSQGVTVTRIIANLHPGADLIITNNSGTVEIGDIIVVSNGNFVNSKSNVIINGTGKTDIFMMRAVGHYDSIKNTTNGDIVALDVGGVTELSWNGNLGRVEHLTDIGVRDFGVNMGAVNTTSAQGRVNGGTDGVTLVAGTPLTAGWTVGSALEIDGAAARLTNAPFDPYLNGVTIRDTNNNDAVESIRVDGSLGDAIIQNTIARLVINSDGTTPFGEFHGLEGVVYSRGNIQYIDVGDGTLAHTRGGPALTSGILAQGMVERVIINGEGHTLRGAVIGLANDLTGNSRLNLDFGIDRIEARNGADIFGVVFDTSALSNFFAFSGQGFSSPSQGINQISIVDGDLIDSVFSATFLNEINIKGGVWDANVVDVQDDIGTIVADHILDTTDPTATSGTNFWRAANLNAITASGTLAKIETNKRAGDIRDLSIDLQGDLERIRARNFDGVSLNVDNSIKKLDAAGSIKRSIIVTGNLDKVAAKQDIARLTLHTAGAIKKFSANGSITYVDVLLDGPDAELKNMQATGDISGTIQVHGAIGKIQSKTGSISGFIGTSSEDGTIKQLRSAVDMLVQTDIQGAVKQIIVGRNFGSGGGVQIGGDVKKFEVGSGTVNANIVIDGALSNMNVGTWATGAQLQTGSEIKSLSIGSDFDGVIKSFADGISKLTIDGSTAESSLIAAYEAGIGTVTIFGDALGEIYADHSIGKIDVRGDGNGNDAGSGDLGGVVRSMVDIDSISVAGDLTGAYLQALHVLGKVVVGGSMIDSILGAGDTIELVSIQGWARQSHVLAGLEDLGEANELGGSLPATMDIFSDAVLKDVRIGGGIDNVVFAAGINGGSDGNFSSLNAETDLASGKSYIESIEVAGDAINANLVVADSGIFYTSFGDGSPDVAVGVLDYDLPTLPGDGTVMEFDSNRTASFVDSDGDTINLALSGDGLGTVEVDGNGDIVGIVLAGTTSRTNVNISVAVANGNGEVDFKNDAFIAGQDDRDMGSLTVQGSFWGASNVMLDANVRDFTARTIQTSGSFRLGGDTAKMQFDAVLDGTFELNRLNDFNVLVGGFSGQMTAQQIDSMFVAGDVENASIWGRDFINSFRSNGSFGTDPVGPELSPSYIASNLQIGSFSVAAMVQSILSAGDYVGTVSIDGDMVDSQILAGMILGNDAQYSGSGMAGDRLSAGIISRVNIKGDAIRSSIAAGVDAGVDTYFGSIDDMGQIGYSAIQSISINGNAVGSQIFSQSFAFIAATEMSNIKVNGNGFQESGNLEAMIFDVSPNAPRVLSADIRLEGEEFYVDIQFSEDISSDSLNPQQGGTDAIEIVSAEQGQGHVDPQRNIDYFVTYDEANSVVTVRFDTGFTNDHPDIYTITVLGRILQSSSGVSLDGNGDGVTGDDYAKNVLIGDAGDRTEANDWDHDLDPQTEAIHFRGMSNLNLVLQDLNTGQGTKNREIHLVEIIGDHGQHETTIFPEKFDVDLYNVTLETGDIFKVTMDPLVGSGFIGAMNLWTLDEDGEMAYVASANTLSSGFMVQADGEYFIEVTGGGGSHLQNLTIAGFAGLPFGHYLDVTNGNGFFLPGMMPPAVPPVAVQNDIGRYELNLSIFNDGDTGFDRGIDLDLIDGQVLRVEGEIGLSTEGYVNALNNQFLDADVFDLNTLNVNGSPISELEEGMIITITLDVETYGSDIGAALELGLFNVDENPNGPQDGRLAAGVKNIAENFGTRNATIQIQIPETGRYAILVQGNVQSNYALEVSVEAATAGDRHGTPRTQNVFIETNGGQADWLGRFGAELEAFNLEQLGFDRSEDQVIASLIDQVEAKFDAMGVTLNVSDDASDFGGQEFTTVFLANNYGQENSFGPTLGIAESLDPMNKDQTEQAVVFVNSHSFFSIGQEDLLANELANTVAHELGHTFGMRHINPQDLGVGVMGGLQIPGLPLSFETKDASLSEFFLGMQNEMELLDWIFDVDANT